MNRTTTAMFKTRQAADRTAAELRSMGVTDVSVHEDSTMGGNMPATNSTDQGIWSQIKGMFGAGDDAHTYDEGMRRGNVVMTVRSDDAHADKVHETIERSDAIDIDAESDGWKQSGWTAPAMSATATRPMGVRDDMAIPIVQESITVGKRDTMRGGARVRSYVVETPVSEQVNLREEHVSLDRRPVDQPVSGNVDELLRERTIEATEHAEEAVVGKRAVVTEEVRLKKDVSDRAETVTDTVRHTEVEVERMEGDRMPEHERMAARGMTDQMK